MSVCECLTVPVPGSSSTPQNTSLLACVSLCVHVSIKVCVLMCACVYVRVRRSSPGCLPSSVYARLADLPSAPELSHDCVSQSHGTLRQSSTDETPCFCLPVCVCLNNYMTAYLLPYWYLIYFVCVTVVMCPLHLLNLRSGSIGESVCRGCVLSSL